MLRTVQAIRYVTPLREGGSLPAIVEADDEGTYVLKFRGAGQGPRALIAELVSGEIGRSLGLPVPEIVLVEIDPALGRAEPDSEIQALLKASAGLNLALDFLPGSIGFDPAVKPPPEPALASAVVWFDAYVTNVDRTARNPNILLWHKRLWLIDHGASLVFHHAWSDPVAAALTPFPAIRSHVLLPFASALREADAELRTRLTSEELERIVGLIPELWLGGKPGLASAAEERAVYRAHLTQRLAAAERFVEEAVRARAQLV
jgi:HipA-like protein